MDLNNVRAFAFVAEAGSFTSAAKALSMPKSTLSRRIAELEEELGVRLLTRTTRKLSLTDAGQALLDQIANPLDDLKTALRSVVNQEGSITGTVRVTAPPELAARMLGAALPQFLARFPEIRIDVDTSAHFVDLVGEGIDVALRAQSTPLPDSSLIARRLGGTSAVLLASPAFIEQHGPFTHPADLKDVPALVHPITINNHDEWTLHGEDDAIEHVKVTPVIRSNSFGLLNEAALGGAGVCLIPLRASDLDHFYRGLVRVLPDWQGFRGSFYAVFPSARLMSPAVRAFIDFLPAALSQKI